MKITNEKGQTVANSFLAFKRKLRKSKAIDPKLHLSEKDKYFVNKKEIIIESKPHTCKGRTKKNSKIGQGIVKINYAIFYA